MVSPLDRKLLRDLWRMKGQAGAIGMVIAVGVMLLVMMSGLTASLGETRNAYYDRYRLADVFAPVARAPEHLAHRLAAIPGVSSVQTRVVGRAQINLPGQGLPVQAQAVSLPDRGDPALNDVVLTDGRMPAAGRPDEILLLASFSAAHGLRPGDRLRATMNGARRSFDIVGLARAPEFLYTTAPGELVPDDARFGVLWMGRSGLAAAYDMAGAFNEALLGLSRGASEASVLAAVDRMLAPYGSSGAYGLADQVSNRFVSEEISGLEAAALGVPPVFLGRGGLSALHRHRPHGAVRARGNRPAEGLRLYQRRGRRAVLQAGPRHCRRRRSGRMSWRHCGGAGAHRGLHRLFQVSLPCLPA